MLTIYKCCQSAKLWAAWNFQSPETLSGAALIELPRSLRPLPCHQTLQDRHSQHF